MRGVKRGMKARGEAERVRSVRGGRGRSVCVREQWKCVKQGEGDANAGSERAPLPAGDESERRNCWRVWSEMMIVGRSIVACSVVQYVWVAVQLV